MVAVIAITYVVVAALARTRAGRMAWGVTLLLAVYWLASLMLPVVTWLMGMALVPGVVGLIILFQGELRTFLSNLGGIFSRRVPATEDTCQKLIDACIRLSRDRTGALIAIERTTPLAEAVSTGVRVDARLSGELLRAIFFHNGPLHDGGVVLCGQRVRAAACQFPTSTNPDLDVSFGMRHRAAIGITETTDCVCLVVSEETGAISVTVDGGIRRNLSRDELEQSLQDMVGEQRRNDRSPVPEEVTDE
jgi:diadenylate cyclase